MSSAAWRGDRRLRVEIEVGARSTRVVSIWLVEGPALQRAELAGTHVARVDVDGALALVESFDDPRLIRGIPPEGGQGHSYLRADTGRVVLDVPVSAEPTLADVQIRLADVSRMRQRPTAPEAAAKLFDERPYGMRILPPVTSAELAAHPDWEQIGPTVGLEATTRGGFEIYVDRAGLYRWRLRRPDGQVVAESARGYANRSACEADLRWVRTTGLQAPVRSLDVPETAAE